MTELVAPPAGARRSERVAAGLAALAGILYNVWPLGYRLDPTALRGTYISVLEVPGRPDAQVFVGCDVLAGLLAVGAGVLLRRHRPVALGLVVFGVGNVLEASIPIDAACARSVASCGIAPGQVLAPHDVASIVSMAGLAIALWGARGYGRWMWAVMALWAVTGLFMAVSVVMVRWVMVAQASFLAGCGVTLIAVPLALVRAVGGGGARGRGR